ncbi:MAG: AMP-binding protein, partial [Candidatus Lambdaproteobacteria bacterium]|nr:AMP-binding protein [Candidatus Lambdaproteobacteria bacterium]
MTEPTTPLLLPERFNVAEHFLGLNAAPERARRPYLYCGEEVLTYGGLRAQVNRAANALRRLGVGPEQRVVLLVQESLLLPVCFWAAVKIGAVAVPLNTALRPADYRFFLDDSRATALL